MKRKLLKSYAIGFLIIVCLWGFAWYGATHQDQERLSDVAYVIAGIIDLPVMVLYGADGRCAPIPVGIAIYLIEAGILALPIYLIFFSWKKQN